MKYFFKFIAFIARSIKLTWTQPWSILWQEVGLIGYIVGSLSVWGLVFLVICSFFISQTVGRITAVLCGTLFLYVIIRFIFTGIRKL